MRVSLIALAVFAIWAAPAAAAPLVCLDPGHASKANLGKEPIGPGSKTMKVKDPGGTAGEAEVTLQIAKRARRQLRAAGFRVAMTRTGPDMKLKGGGNVARARFCNRRHAALVFRIHADGSTSSSMHGLSTLYPAKRKGWTDDVLPASLRVARIVQDEVLATTGAADLGLVTLRPDRVQLVERPDLPGRDRLHDEPRRADEAALAVLPGEDRAVALATRLTPRLPALGLERSLSRSRSSSSCFCACPVTTPLMSRARALWYSVSIVVVRVVLPSALRERLGQVRLERASLELQPDELRRAQLDDLGLETRSAGRDPRRRPRSASPRPAGPP